MDAQVGFIRRHRNRRGVTMLMVMMVMATLLLGGVVGVGMQLANLRSSGLSLANKRAYYCAESGLAAGRDFFRLNAAKWNEYLRTNYILTGRASNTDPGLIYIVGISDNVDEFPPAVNDPLVDRDQTVLLRAQCTDTAGHQSATVQQYLTLRPLGGGLKVKVGSVIYKTTTDFTDGGAIPNCNGCGIIGQGGAAVANTTTGNGTTQGANGGGSTSRGVSGNDGLSAIGVDLSNDQIILAAKTAYPFIWVPLSIEGYVSKLDTVNGKEMARYRTGPAYGNPSRTTVDLDGDVWVTNRANNTVTKIGLFENGRCIDRNNDGIITTSMGGGDVKDWTGEWGAGVAGAQDECILLHVALKYPGATSPVDARMVVVDADNNVYTGGLTAPGVFKIRGTDGAVLYGKDTKQGHYGGVMDRDGYIWSMHVGSGNVEKISSDLQTSTLFPIGHPGYGVALDLNGRVWTSSWTPTFSRMDPDGTHLQVFQQGEGKCCAQGITTNGNGDVFIAGSLSSNHIGHYDNDGNFIKNYIVGDGPTGVAIDAAGKVWSPSYNAMQINRINLDDDTIDVFPLGGHSYTYSDTTGYVVRNITSPQGTWSVTQYCGNTCSAWASVSWDADLPAKTQIRVRARSALTTTALKTATWQNMKNNATIPENGPRSLRGPLIEVEVRLTSLLAGVTPVLHQLAITPW